MTIKSDRSFRAAGGRHYFDSSLKIGEGWAQLDSKQDAPYYGTWVNAERRQMITFCEGDVTTSEASTDEEFVQMVRKTVEWHDANGSGPARIDGMLSTEIIDAFTALGLGDLLH